MSGGHFDYKEYQLLQWARDIQLEIARSGKPITKKRDEYGSSYDPLQINVVAFLYSIARGPKLLI